ncbi:16S rRNA (cytosine967-C5)-methyltransferase [Chitinivorax tropicus]|uniref:16S rRNA (cytosine(967)-C(5))-methyltransferase n=1 Tax=Chitinivorax tropicus TaxID=714531 RepID=A0A840MIL3_9PROT|nr:16S rRNA (cytosine(967)-C(5))-methyltransferase RsmB [Chitinivorax tropicus]MBB5017355.1 16S rRNA (cytosine967-C5)-methyltransferase [Chitinivorax tropicus]
MLAIQRGAMQVVSEVLAGRNLNDALSQHFRQYFRLEPAERAAIQDISYGTLRHLGWLRAVLSKLLLKPLTDPQLEPLLLIAIYQLEYTRAAPYAIVDHAVTVTTKIGAGGAKGLVNAILRNFQRQRETLLKLGERNEVACYSHPQWWINLLKKHYPTEWQAMLATANSHPPMTLRINARKTDAPAYLKLLAEAGIAAKWLDDAAIQLLEAVPVTRLPQFAEGWVSVQDEGAQLAAKLLDLQEGQSVLDACAAPGGKTCHMLEMAKVDVIAIDHDEARLSRVHENLSRLQLSATVKCGDAAKPTEWWDGKPFDRILADVPCSASGVVRRHPDIKWLRRETDIAQFATQQAEILDALWPLLAEGGKLLYATCSIFPQENGEQINAFLARHEDAVLLPLAGEIQQQLTPNARHDGFYYALLAKGAPPAR